MKNQVKKSIILIALLLIMVFFVACHPKPVEPSTLPETEHSTGSTTGMTETFTLPSSVFEETTATFLPAVTSEETTTEPSQQIWVNKTSPATPKTEPPSSEKTTTTKPSSTTSTTTTTPKTTTTRTTTTKTTTTTAKPKTTTTAKTTKPATTTVKPTTKTTTTTVKTTTTTTKKERPFTPANLVAMINEERARVGNPVKVFYGDATLQKIADIRAKEQLRLFGHTRPMPCPGCDYCHGEKECISGEAYWIKLTYGEKYAHGSCAIGEGGKFHSVEDFLETIKLHPSHYNQMFKASWNRFAVGEAEVSFVSSAYYFNYGNW